MRNETMSYMPKSKSDVHITPDRVYDIIKDVWGYTKDEMFDPCPVDWKEDGLKIEWHKLNFVNPPYSLLKEFVAKAIHESTLAHYTIMLLPSKTEQQWFHDIVVERRFDPLWIRRRLKFKNNKHHATQPHFLVLIK